MNDTILLPADTYIVINKTLLDEHDRKLLISLYQPIIGTIATSFYFSLWSYLDKMELFSTEWTHHHLMGNMGVSLHELVIAREKLEGIGLLKTYVKKDSVNHYVYELYSPLSASEFFSNPILSTALYSNVGLEEYEKLVAYFKTPRINLKDYEDITKKLTDVFTQVNCENGLHLETEIRKKTKRKLELVSKLDLDDIFALIPDDILNLKSVTRDTKDFIYRLGFIYDLDNAAVSNLIRNSITERKTIDKNLLRKNARNYYKFETDGKLPGLAYKNQPEYLRKPIGDTSPKAKMIYQFETISPYDFLCMKNHGGKPSRNDKLILEYLLLDLGLMPGVVNVLIDYVLRINDNKLTKNFVEVIASQWARNNVKTVADAMKLAQKEMAKRKKTKSSPVKKTAKTPAWFDSNAKEEAATDEEILKMEAMIEQFK